ncbi:MAG: hypothetical protein WCK78_17415 [Paludibacter sp.]
MLTRKFIILFLHIFLLLAAVPTNTYAQTNRLSTIVDMVHNNPGEKPYQTKFNDPAVLKTLGYDSKTFFIFLSPQLAINWDAVDPDILPMGSEDRKWVDAKAAEIHKLYRQMKKQGMKVYCMSDLILFPKRLIAKYGMEQTFDDPQNPQTEKYLRILIDEMFRQFPELDGIFVRIGETYLHDAPFHKGGIKNQKNPDKTIIPLMSILRDEICVKLNKKLFFRTWLSIDTSVDDYLKVSNAIEPHENLTIAVKHCEGDFHRGNPFSKVLGIGMHKQIVEVQCAREYEGKGAYPNYIAHGVIDGFEEHSWLRKENKIASIGELREKSTLMTGLWTWSRGGGWEGPYIQNEFWPELNVYVLSQWAQNTKESEAIIFNRYAREKLSLSEKDVQKFRRLALLSEKAILLGRRSQKYPTAVNTWWTRDQYISFPSIPSGKDSVLNILAEKDESVKLWKEMVGLSGEIQFKDKQTASFVKVSTLYGLQLYEIYRSLFYLTAIQKGIIPMKEKAYWMEIYEKAWKNYTNLAQENPDCPTLYDRDVVRRQQGQFSQPAELVVRKL